jgi:hypothetical protein
MRAREAEDLCQGHMLTRSRARTENQGCLPPKAVCSLKRQSERGGLAQCRYPDTPETEGGNATKGGELTPAKKKEILPAE